MPQGEQPGVAAATDLPPVPPPYAWKLYFAALAAVSCHAHRMSDVLDLMHRLGVPPQAACYVVALQQMAKQGIGPPAYTKVLQMKVGGSVLGWVAP